MRRSAPTGAARTASAMVGNGFPPDPSAGSPDPPGGPTKSTAGAISRGLPGRANHGGAASHALKQSRTKDQSRTRAVWCLGPRPTNELAARCFGERRPPPDVWSAGPPSHIDGSRDGRRAAMTKAELVEAVAAQASGLSRKSAGELVDFVFDSLGRAIRNDGRFSYPGFGTWSVRMRRARRGRNPRTGAELRIAAARTVGFRPARELKASL